MELSAPPLSSTKTSMQSILNAIIWPSHGPSLFSGSQSSYSCTDLVQTGRICCHLPVRLITFNLLIKAEKLEFTVASKSGDNHTIDGVVCVYS